MQFYKKKKTAISLVFPVKPCQLQSAVWSPLSHSSVTFQVDLLTWHVVYICVAKAYKGK